MMELDKRLYNMIDTGRIFIACIMAGILGLLFQSCEKGESVLEQQMPYGSQISVNISVGYAVSSLETRSIVQEILVENINIYIVNESGDLVEYGYYTDGTVSLNIGIMKDMKYTVYAIANAGREIYATTAHELENLVHEIDDISQITTTSGALLMAGKSDAMLLEDGKLITIDITRCAAKILLKADFSKLNSDVEIDIKSIQLKNAPKSVKLFTDNKIEGAEEAMDGEMINNPALESLSNDGIQFYLFENRQGTLLPNNSDQTKKVFPEDSDYYNTCSFVEMKGSYSSSRKRGEILYRFYLGTDMTSNFDVIRNTQHNITVNFIGDGAVDENTWRVDNSEIIDLVESIILDPVYHLFPAAGLNLQLNAVVLPLTASNKRLAWSSSNESVAIVDDNGLVTSTGEGTCTITAKSTDGTDISAVCDIVVMQPEIEFAEKTKVMYDMEQSTLSYSKLIPSMAKVEVESSDESVVQVLESDASGIKIKALKEGSSVITATVAGTTVKTSCTVDVEKLRIEPAERYITVYNHFYHDVAYTIHPSHASDMPVDLESAYLGKDKNMEPVENYPARVLGKYSSDQQLPLRIYIQGREDVYADMSVTVKEPSMTEFIRVSVNYGKEKSVEKDLMLGIAKHANLQYSITPHATESSYIGTLGNSIQLDFSASKIIFPNPNGANGKFLLNVKAIGDDNTNISLNCDIEIYETIYLIGISKTDTRENINRNRYRYYNEILGEWLAHPNSLFYKDGIVTDITIPYIYDGKEYTDKHTGLIVEQEFEFENDRSYDLALDEGYFTYDGDNAPYYYHEYFSLTPKENTPYQMDKESKRHFYVYSRNFMSGFSNDSSPDWEKVFEYVYGY